MDESQEGSEEFGDPSNSDSDSASTVTSVLENSNIMGTPSVLQHVPFPNKLELNEDSTKTADWKLFRQIWDNYEISSGLNEHTKRRRTATLLTCFAPSALKVFNAISFENEADNKDIDIVLQKMTDVCKGVTNDNTNAMFLMFVYRKQENLSMISMHPYCTYPRTAHLEN